MQWALFFLLVTRKDKEARKNLVYRNGQGRMAGRLVMTKGRASTVAKYWVCAFRVCVRARAFFSFLQRKVHRAGRRGV